MPASLEPFVNFLKTLDAEKSPHSAGVNYLGHSVAVYRYLERAGYSEEVARAGLFHSIYGTALAQQIRLPLTRRDEIRVLIGERAERLAYLNCAVDRESFDAAVERGAPPFQTFNRLTGQSQEISDDDFDDLVKVHLYDHLEQVARTKRFGYRRASFERMAHRLGPASVREYKKVIPPPAPSLQELGIFGRSWRVLRNEGPAVAFERAVQAVLWPMLHRLVDSRVDRLRDDIARQARSTAAIADVVGELGPRPRGAQSTDSPQISLIMPVWNRAHLVSRAIESVIRQSIDTWELLIVNDGSGDGLEASIASYLDDPRIRASHQDRRGAAAARNVALSQSSAQLIGYLDSDCVLYPGALQAAVEAFRGAPRTECLYMAQHWFHPGEGAGEVRADAFDRLGLMNGRARLDLNAFFHRRSVYERCGGFDEELTRLQDLDLILRYTEHAKPDFVPALVGRYETGHFGITDTEKAEPNRDRILAKWRSDGQTPPRILYAVLNHPQLSEAYIRFEIDEMRRRGADVSVWSETPPVATYEVAETVYGGALDSAINHVKPDVIHLHWAHFAERQLTALFNSGIPITIRGHGFDFAPERIERLFCRPGIHRIYLYPHHAAQVSESPKIVPTPAALPLRQFRPGIKDRRLVLRAAALLPTKDLELFVRVAKRLPGFRFVLCLARVHEFNYAAEFLKFVEDEGSPVDVRLDVPHDECFALFREAGLYLHSLGNEEPFGMPISIAQALASECYTLVRDVEGAHEYLGDAGALYRDEDDVVERIEGTGAWTDDQWTDCQAKASARAWNFDAESVLDPMYRDWRALASARLASESSGA